MLWIQDPEGLEKAALVSLRDRGVFTFPWFVMASNRRRSRPWASYLLSVIPDTSRLLGMAKFYEHVSVGNRTNGLSDT